MQVPIVLLFVAVCLFEKGQSNIFYTLWRFNSSVSSSKYMRVSSSWIESNTEDKSDLFNEDILSLSYAVGPYFPLDSMTFNFINLDKLDETTAMNELDCFLLSKNNSFVKCSFYSNPTVSYRGISSLEEFSEFKFPGKGKNNNSKSLNKIIDNSESSSPIYLDHSISFKFNISEYNYFVFLGIVFIGGISSLISVVWFCLNLFRCVQLTSENRRLKEATNREEKVTVRRSLLGENVSEEEIRSQKISITSSNESVSSKRKLV